MPIALFGTTEQSNLGIVIAAASGVEDGKVVIRSFARRSGVVVVFTVELSSLSAATATADILTAYLVSSTFIEDLHAQGGGLAYISSITVISAPAVATFPTTDQAQPNILLLSTSDALGIAALIAIAVVGMCCVCMMFAIILCFRRHYKLRKNERLIEFNPKCSATTPANFADVVVEPYSGAAYVPEKVSFSHNQMQRNIHLPRKMSGVDPTGVEITMNSTKLVCAPFDSSKIRV